jgi:CRP-like cAMP-binding protein
LPAVHALLVANAPFYAQRLSSNPTPQTSETMTATLLKRPLQLILHPQDVLPEAMSWRLHEGYVRAMTWDLEGESITLGLWGPGDVITSEDPGLNPLELQCLTTVVVEHIELEPDLHRSQLQRERQMLAELLTIQRIRSADRRLLALLGWIAQSFGQVNSRGCRLSLSELNLTHKALAELCGLTRVTVTKLLSRFRLDGQLVPVSDQDLLIPRLS